MRDASRNLSTSQQPNSCRKRAKFHRNTCSHDVSINSLVKTSQTDLDLVRFLCRIQLSQPQPTTSYTSKSRMVKFSPLQQTKLAAARQQFFRRTSQKRNTPPLWIPSLTGQIRTPVLFLWNVYQIVMIAAFRTDTGFDGLDHLFPTGISVNQWVFPFHLGNIH